MGLPLIDAQTREQRLDEAIAAYLKAMKSGPAPDRQEWVSRHADLAADLEAFFADRDQFDRLAAPLRMVLPSAPVTTRHPPFTQIGNYELLEEIASGGMGVVYKARQINLNRIVALKMLRAGPQATPADLQRFRTEVEAVAHLDHANIVPIYEVGEHAGQPFFSMKLVEEGSLATKVKNWALAAGCPAGTRQIAGLMLKVAGAIHFAHQHGILHRDLKPANILVDARGEPYVTDFGLAKRINPSSLAPHPGPPPGGGGEGWGPITQSGSILGTPAYMAPEQAEPSALGEKGERRGVTTAADVYSLGAILYELLTGRPPFQGETAFETVRQLLEEEPSPPRNVNPRISRDLQTICLKCLDKDPRRRHASALALAEDLERFLAGEPIQARPVGSLERTWRWCRRKPIVASLAASLVLAVLGGLTVVSWLWRQAEHHRQTAENHWQEAERQWSRAEDNLAEADRQRILAETNLQEAKVQRAEAENSFRMAHEAVNAFCTRVDEALVDVPGLQSLRKKVLETGLNYYQTFLNKRAHDPKIKEELAATQFRVARITSAIGSKENAFAAYERAKALYLELLRDKPKQVSYLTELAHTYNNIGVLQNDLGRPANALGSFQQSRDLWEQIVRESPQSSEYRGHLATACNNLGGSYGDAGRPAEALATLEKARDLREELVSMNPQVAGFQRDLGEIYGNLAVYYGKAGDFQKSFQTYRKSSEIYEQLVRDYPNNSHYQADLAVSYRRLAIGHNRNAGADEAKKAKEWLVKSRAILERLMKNEPNVIRFQGELGLCCRDLGATCQKLSQQPDALQAYHQALAIFEKMARANPAVFGYRRELGKSYYHIGILHGAARHTVEAQLAYQQAREVQEKLLQAFPGNLDCHSDLGWTLNNLGLILRDRGRPEERIKVLQEALEHQRLAYDQARQPDQFRFALQCHYGALAEVYRAAGQAAEAVAATLERKKFWPNNPDELYKVAQEICAAADLIGKGKVDLPPDEEAQRRQFGDHAMQALREAVAAGFKDVKRLREDRALDPLRQRPDFKGWLDEVAKKPNRVHE